jgi:hypothetical protein
MMHMMHQLPLCCWRMRLPQLYYGCRLPVFVFSPQLCGCTKPCKQASRHAYVISA